MALRPVRSGGGLAISGGLQLPSSLGIHKLVLLADNFEPLTPSFSCTVADSMKISP